MYIGITCAAIAENPLHQQVVLAVVLKAWVPSGFRACRNEAGCPKRPRIEGYEVHGREVAATKRRHIGGKRPQQAKRRLSPLFSCFLFFLTGSSWSSDHMTGLGHAPVQEIAIVTVHVRYTRSNHDRKNARQHRPSQLDGWVDAPLLLHYQDTTLLSMPRCSPLTRQDDHDMTP
jgi:hypothetical protein